jgi:hypothetical protein
MAPLGKLAADVSLGVVLSFPYVPAIGVDGCGWYSRFEAALALLLIVLLCVAATIYSVVDAGNAGKFL